MGSWITHWNDCGSLFLKYRRNNGHPLTTTSDQHGSRNYIHETHPQRWWPNPEWFNGTGLFSYKKLGRLGCSGSIHQLHWVWELEFDHSTGDAFQLAPRRICWKYTYIHIQNLAILIHFAWSLWSSHGSTQHELKPNSTERFWFSGRNLPQLVIPTQSICLSMKTISHGL